jgi:hypothetical protein
MPPPWPASTARLRPDGPSSYDEGVNALEPTVLWRLYHPSGRHARAVLLPGSPQLTLTFFIDNVMDRAENFDTMELALFRSDDVRRSLAGDGWKDDA